MEPFLVCVQPIKSNKMKPYIAFFISFFMLYSFDLMGQSTDGMVLPSGGKYVYEGELYKYKELANIMATKKEPFVYFQKAVKQKINANVYGVISLVMIGGGMILTSTAEVDESVSGEFVTGILLAMAGSIPGTVALLQNSSAKRNRKKSIIFFNDLESQSNLYYKDDYYMSFGLAPNGLGVVYQF